MDDSKKHPGRLAVHDGAFVDLLPGEERTLVAAADGDEP
jgi:hypothetical protein